MPAEMENDEPRKKTTKALEAERRNRLYRELREKGIENMENWMLLSKKTDGETPFRILRAGYQNAKLKKSRWKGFLANPETSPQGTGLGRKNKAA